MYKQERQQAIRDIIGSAEITNQASLVSKLIERGFTVTQASVSRDLDELGIAKVNGHYEVLQSREPIPEFGVVSFETAGNSLIVGKCLSGLASAITVSIDKAAIPEIVGTIAGDDTIFIAVKGETEQRAVMSVLADKFG